MTQDRTSLPEQRELAARMLKTIEFAAPEDVLGRLRVRLRDLGDDVGDEVLQFRELRKACLESPRLAAALEDAGFGKIDLMDPVKITPEAGRVVQIFNRLVEEHWEGAEEARFRKVVYTKDDLDTV